MGTSLLVRFLMVLRSKIKAFEKHTKILTVARVDKRDNERSRA